MRHLTVVDLEHLADEARSEARKAARIPIWYCAACLAAILTGCWLAVLL